LGLRARCGQGEAKAEDHLAEPEGVENRRMDFGNWVSHESFEHEVASAFAAGSEQVAGEAGEQVVHWEFRDEQPGALDGMVRVEALSA
jgi:hypothetical protein